MRAPFILLALLSVGCTAVTDGLFEPPLETSAGGSGGAASAGGNGANQGATGAGGPVCGGTTAPVSSECPAACTGGCEEGTCVIACATKDACKARHLVCPPDLHCELTCSGAMSCADASLRCPLGQRCDVSCSAKDACKNAVIDAFEGPITLACGDADKSCDKAKVHCGTNECTASCEGSSRPELSCGDACACSGC